MLKFQNPENVPPPFGRYSHSVEVGAGARWLHVSGQVGVAEDGKLGEGITAQCENAFKNLLEILKQAEMSVADVVKITAYLVNPEHVASFREVRNEFIGDALPASTLVVVEALAAPDWLVEIELIAART